MFRKHNVRRKTIVRRNMKQEWYFISLQKEDHNDQLEKDNNILCTHSGPGFVHLDAGPGENLHQFQYTDR